MERRVQGPYYDISERKLDEIVVIIRRELPVSRQRIIDIVMADYPEGQEHQAWLDSASAQEIADWAWPELLLRQTDDEGRE